MPYDTTALAPISPLSPVEATTVPGDEDGVGDQLDYPAFQRLFSTLRVRWGEESPRSMLPAPAKRAKLLGWGRRDLVAVERMTGITTTLPRICPGPCKEEPSAGCPCAALYGCDPKVWKGSPCPGESVRAYQHFVRYVRELGVRGGDHVDVQHVIDLVQLHLMEDRCTEEIQRGGMFDVQESLVNAKTGAVYTARKISVVLELKERLQNQRLRLYDKMMASREKREMLRQAAVREHMAAEAARLKKAALEPDPSAFPPDISTMFSQLARRHHETRHYIQNASKPPLLEEGQDEEGDPDEDGGEDVLVAPDLGD